jgi:sugar phosphate isomerase/epimerase
MPEIVAYLNQAFFDAGDAFLAAKGAGFSAVEIPEMYFEPPEDNAGCVQLKQEAEELALDVIWHTHPAYNRNLGSADEAARKQDIDRMVWELDFVGRTGWRTFVIHPGNAETEDDKARVYDSLTTLSEKAGSLGIQMALENASGPFNGDPNELAGICQRAPGMKLTYDCSHAFRSEFCTGGSGSIVDHVSIARPFIHSIQFNDYDGSRNCALGEGEIPWDDVMPIALALDCETWTIELKTIEETVASKVYLERWLDGVAGCQPRPVRAE